MADPKLTPDNVGATIPEPPVEGAGSWQKAPADSVLFYKPRGAPESARAPRFGDVRQGPLGDCFALATLSCAALHDPQLIRDHIRQVGTQDGDRIYGAIFFLPVRDTATLERFERAADDVTEPHTGATLAPLWVLVTDRVFRDRAGDPISADVEVPREGAVSWVQLAEKAAAVRHGRKTGYRTIAGGGYSGKYMEELTARPFELVALERKADPKEDRRLADEQFGRILDGTRERKLMSIGSSDDKAARVSLAQDPQYDERGNSHDEKGRPIVHFDAKRFAFVDGDGNAASTGTAAPTGSDDSRGAGWVGEHKYSLLRAYEQGGVKLVELRNPWGDVRPAKWSDDKKTEDGIILIPWYIVRPLFVDVVIGGRGKDDRAPQLQHLRAPRLPTGAQACALE
jgi:hypothetical protein